MLSQYKSLLIGALVIFSTLFYIYNLKSQINTLQLQVKDCYVDIANYKLSNERLKNSLNIRNSEVEDAKLNEEVADKKLKDWLAKPQKVKYKVITKIREIKSDDCKDIKQQLKAVRDFNISSLYDK